jgi:hypothetical protein
MSTTYATRNTATVFAQGYGSYTYFVRCIDVNGNVMSSPTIISFLNNVPPSAEIIIDGDEPLRADTYRLTLRSSVPLSGIPTLTYNLQESGKQQQVALTGEDDTWNGFVIIPPGIADTVVGFSFSGTSLQGVKGTQITEGSLFTIDAKPPAAIDALSLENTSTQIKLKWFSANVEDRTAYNIYRADHEGVSYTDYYASTRLTEYSDTHPSGARYFYYRVAPVDDAGNIGPLSMEVYGTAIDQEARESVPALDPLLSARIDEEIASITSALLDANATLLTLEQESNPIHIRIIREMDLIEQGREGRLKMESAMNMLKELRARSPSSDETDATIAQTRQLVANGRNLLIRKIFAREQTETTQVSDPAAVERMLPYALLGHNVSTADKKNYIQQSVQLQDRITVSLSALTFTLYDVGGHSTDYTLVRRTISSQDPQSGITLIESIPKSVASDADEIHFSKEVTILERDPVVQYTLGVLEHEEYTYFVKRLVPLSDVKEARVFAYGPLPEQAQASDLITGQVVRSGLPKGNDMILILVGAIIIVGLGAYYVSLAKEPKPFKLPVERKKSMPPMHTKIVHAQLHMPQAASPDPEQMLQQALAAINEKHYDTALSLYLKAVELQKNDAHASEETNMRVYTKLLLFKRLTEAKHAAEEHDAASLRRALQEVLEISKTIGNESTVLMTEAKASYADFVRVLNALEIERMGKY